jgi:hypothetical protein
MLFLINSVHSILKSIINTIKIICVRLIDKKINQKLFIQIKINIIMIKINSIKIIHDIKKYKIFILRKVYPLKNQLLKNLTKLLPSSNKNIHLHLHSNKNFHLKNNLSSILKTLIKLLLVW